MYTSRHSVTCAQVTPGDIVMLHTITLLFTVLYSFSYAVRVQWVNQQAVWSSEPGGGGDFTIQVELRYPPFTVEYQPNFWQYLKFAWIQYLAIFVVFWWVLSYVQSFVFENQVILTVRQRTDKLHCD